MKVNVWNEYISYCKVFGAKDESTWPLNFALLLVQLCFILLLIRGHGKCSWSFIYIVPIIPSFMVLVFLCVTSMINSPSKGCHSYSSLSQLTNLDKGGSSSS